MRHSMRLRFLQQGKDLLPLHTRKTFEEVRNGVTRLKMVKQTLNGHPGPGKDRLASENFRVPRNDFLHENMIAPDATLCEPKLLPSMEARIWQRVREVGRIRFYRENDSSRKRYRLELTADLRRFRPEETYSSRSFRSKLDRTDTRAGHQDEAGRDD